MKIISFIFRCSGRQTFCGGKLFENFNLLDVAPQFMCER